MRDPGLLHGEHVAYARVLPLAYLPCAYPVPRHDRDEALDVIAQWLASQHVLTGGRCGGWRYERGNADHAIQDGVRMADEAVEVLNGS